MHRTIRSSIVALAALAAGCAFAAVASPQSPAPAPHAVASPLEKHAPTASSSSSFALTAQDVAAVNLASMPADTLPRASAAPIHALQAARAAVILERRERERAQRSWRSWT
jgi:hypothetical protein